MTVEPEPEPELILLKWDGLDAKNQNLSLDD